MYVVVFNRALSPPPPPSPLLHVALEALKGPITLSYIVVVLLRRRLGHLLVVRVSHPTLERRPHRVHVVVVFAHDVRPQEGGSARAAVRATVHTHGRLGGVDSVLLRRGLPRAQNAIPSETIITSANRYILRALLTLAVGAGDAGGRVGAVLRDRTGVCVCLGELGSAGC